MCHTQDSVLRDQNSFLQIKAIFVFSFQPVLDEATSQISVDAESQLYAACVEKGITLVSVGHRDTLRKFHDMELRLDGKGGWMLKAIDGNIQI